MINILMVEDQEDLREFTRHNLEPHDILVDEAPDFKTACKKLEHHHYAVVLLDLGLPDGDGIDLLDKYPAKLDSRTIIITANPTIPSVVEAIKKGAFNYLEKPFTIPLLLTQINKIMAVDRMQTQLRSLKNQMTANFTFDAMVYKSEAMAGLVSRALVLARTDNTVLIQGETGTGKEVIARAVYNESMRRKKLFLPVNCAAIPAELFESELFGFEKGAFTGAVDSYGGRFAQADGGTLFLDEIGELPMAIQAKLLRVLDDNTIYRLKSRDPLQVDVRLLAATNRNLEVEAAEDRFRSDLYFRLKESALRIPPLRERIEDILPMVHYYMDVYNQLYDKQVTNISREAEAFFLDYPWPGNIRELKNTVKSIIPFKENDTIDISDFSQSVLEDKVIEDRQFVTLAELERKHIIKVMKVTGYNITRACEVLAISRPRLYRKIKLYRLEDMVKEG